MPALKQLAIMHPRVRNLVAALPIEPWATNAAGRARPDYNTPPS